MLYTLLIDTSTERGLFALARGPKICFYEKLPFGLESSKFLIKAIQRGFAKLGISALDLKACGVCTGPGSFTGIRVGASLAQGISLARGIPLISLSSLEGLIHEDEGEFLSVIDARAKSVYVLMQKKQDQCFVLLSKPQLLPLQEVIPLASNRPIITPFAGKIKKFLPLSIHWIERSADPSHLAILAEEAFVDKNYSFKGESRLNYLRNLI